MVNVDGIIQSVETKHGAFKYPAVTLPQLRNYIDFQLVNVGKLLKGAQADVADRVLTKIFENFVVFIHKAERKIELPFGGANPASSEFGVQELRPQNLEGATSGYIGYGNETRWQWTAGSSASVAWAAEDTMINHTLDKDEFALIYGYFNNDPLPNTVEIFIQPGATKLPIRNVELLRALAAEPRVLLFEPIIIEASSMLVVKVAARTASLAEDAGLLGYFAAPTSKLITENY